jgi:hypothetical protein
MVFRATEFLDSAKRMLEEQSEVGRRNAVSRSYYASFHEAQRVADEICESNDHLAMATHERIRERLKDCQAVARGRVLAVILQGLKMLRVRADYNLEMQLSPTEVDAHVKVADKFCTEMEQLSVASNSSIGQNPSS